MASEPLKVAVRSVKPIISGDKKEARRKVLNLYRKWFGEIPLMIKHYNMAVTYEEVRSKIKQEFLKNKHVTDIRIIDMLVIKGELEFKEVQSGVKPRCHVMYWMKDTQINRFTLGDITYLTQLQQDRYGEPDFMAL